MSAVLCSPRALRVTVRNCVRRLGLGPAGRQARLEAGGGGANCFRDQIRCIASRCAVCWWLHGESWGRKESYASRVSKGGDGGS